MKSITNIKLYQEYDFHCSYTMTDEYSKGKFRLITGHVGPEEE